jgi:putative acetyltransferase
MKAARSSAVALRPFLPSDAARCASIFSASIFALAAEDYDEDQLSAWAASAEDVAAFGARLAGGLTLVATIEGAVVGFASLKGVEALDMLYVHPEFARRGVGAMLVDALTRLATGRGAKRLTADASDAAKALFERHGFIARARNVVEVRGEWLANTTMDKALSVESAPDRATPSPKRNGG